MIKCHNMKKRKDGILRHFYMNFNSGLLRFSAVVVEPQITAA